MGLIDAETSNGVTTITLGDVDRRNVLSRELLTELMDAIDALEADPDVRVAVVTNRGHVFCAGADLAERSANEGLGAARSVELRELFQRIQESPTPFVGRINGHCVAGGVGLAAVMDISLCVDTAMFGFSEVRVGVAPAIISVVCLPKMRLADAREAFLRGHRFSASEAARMGLINRSLAANDLDDEVAAVVNDLLAGEPGAIGEAKRLTREVPSMPTEEAFEWTARLSASLFASDAAREGMSAFLEKRPASWVRRVSDGNA